jgi:hypothetical protein
MVFLTERSFYVHYYCNQSQNHNIKAGVPQGSIISAILFSIYNSDIHKKLTNSHVLFTDYLNLWKSEGKFKKSHLHLEINKFKQSFQEFHLSINCSKYINDTKSYQKITLDTNPKLLGITFDLRLSFTNRFKDSEFRILTSSYFTSFCSDVSAMHLILSIVYNLISAHIRVIVLIVVFYYFLSCVG